MDRSASPFAISTSIRLGFECWYFRLLAQSKLAILKHNSLVWQKFTFALSADGLEFCQFGLRFRLPLPHVQFVETSAVKNS